jgi:hypothetical protein
MFFYFSETLVSTNETIKVKQSHNTPMEALGEEEV